ncbi:CHAT domain-containing protein, partial [Angustibacter speluncae]
RARGAPTASVLRACRAGLDDLDGHRATLASTELRALASGHGVELALVGLRALLPDASPVRVLGWLELVRAAALSRVARVAPDAGAFDRLRALHADLDAAREAGAADRADRLLARLTQEEQRLREDAWAAPGSVDPAARVPPAVLRQALGARTLVELAELDGDLLAVVVSSSGARLVRLGPAADAQRLVHAVQFALRRLAAGGGASAPAVAATVHRGFDRLRTLLVDPLGVAPTAPLVVAPVGALQRVPWSALHEGPVSVTPSASLWARTARPSARPPDRTGATLLVAGPGLPGSHDEVGRLAGLHPGATVLRDPATVPAVLDAFAGAGVAHLSCHAHVRSDSPLFTSLVMDDGPLTLHELLATAAGRGVPEVVVLASCESGVEAAAPGDEPLGFVSTLLAHGSRGVVASSVLVPDDAAVPLMVGLHAGLVEGRTASDALHAARADLDRDDPRTLVAWCAFSAYGAG